VFSNKGERVIDPNPQLSNNTFDPDHDHAAALYILVDIHGIVKVPMVGKFKLEGLTPPAG